MKSAIMSIGNSCWIRLPRHGGDEAFARLRDRGDDNFLGQEESGSSWDEKEWKW